MLIKINNDKYIDPKKVEAVVIVPAGGCYDVFVNTIDSSYPFSKGHKTSKEAEKAMDELASIINAN